MLKAVIFDVDGVIVDSREANIALLQGMLEKAGYATPTREQVLSHFHRPLVDSVKEFTGSTDEKEIDRVMQTAFLPELKQGKLFEFPDNLISVLKELHKTYKLGIVTSRIQLGMDHVFDAVDIQKYFEVVLTKDDYKHPKPHPEPLLMAIDKLGVKAEEAVYIGDSESDMQSAKAAGIHFIYYGKERKGVASVDSFSSIPEALASLLP